MKTFTNPSKVFENRLNYLLLLFTLLFGVSSYAQSVIQSTTGGGIANWSAPGTWVGGIPPTNGDEVTIKRNIVVDQASVSVGKLTIDPTFTLTFAASNTALFEVTGSVTVNGTFNDAQAAGVNRFKGGIINNTNTFTSASPVEFFGTSQSLDGAGAMNLNSTVTIVNNILISNNISHVNGLYIGDNLDGIGIISSLQNNTLIRYAGADIPFLNGGILNTSVVGNTFQYMRAGDQNIRPTIYYNLSIAGSGNKNFTDLSINGNFTRTGGTLLQPTGTLKFSGNTDATYTNGSTPSWNDIVIEKTGASLTLNNNLTTTSLTIGLGTLNLSTTARTVIVNGDFEGAGTLDASGANHIITLRGANNSIGSFITGSSTTTVNYDLLSGTSQTLFGSLNYKNITLANSLTGPSKVLGGPIAIGGNFRFNANFVVELGAFNLTFINTGTFSSSTSWTPLNTANRMFVTEGSGKFIIEKTSAAGFTSVNATNANGYIPLGASGVHNAFNLSALSATVTGTGRIELRVVPTRQPNIPYYNFALQKHWKIETANLSSINANASFFFNGTADVIGSAVNYVPIAYNGMALVTPTGSSSPGSNPFSTVGTSFLAGDWTAYDPAVRTTLYSYQSGDWADPLTWTTDPSGTTSVFPLVPGVGDAVVILNGRNVFTNTTRSVASMVIQDGATLDLKTTTGNNLGPVSGQGLLRLSSLSLPTGTSNNNLATFVLPTGGTIEYYDLGSGSFVLPITTPYTNTFNNLIVSNSTNSGFDLYTNANITINGNFNLSKSGSGAAGFRIGNTATDRSITVNGDFTVGSGCIFSPSTLYAGNHTMTIVGNSTISGTAHFTNGTYNDAAVGRIRLTLSGLATNTSFISNPGSSVWFWDVSMNKTEGSEILINGATGTIDFRRNPGVRIENTSGIMRLGSGINITLGTTDGTNYNIGQSNRFPVLWIDGATAIFNGSNSIVPYGTLKITSGSVDAVTGSINKTITLRENGLLQIDGGTLTMACLRVSVLDENAHRGAYIQSGGTVNLTGETGPETYYATFALPYPQNVFKMSGGVLNLTKAYNSGVTLSGGLHIGSTPQNYEVTGGTVNIYSTGNNLIDISSTAPFYNVNITKVGTGSNGQVRLRAFTWNYNGNAANNTSTGAFPLVVLNDFNIQTTGSPIFDAGAQDVVVKNNMTIASGATYVSGNNTLLFDGNGAQSFTVNGGTSFFGSGNNLLNGPEDINGSNYTLEGVSVSVDVGLAPDNTNSAELLMETNSNGRHRFYTAQIATDDIVTGSMFVKPNGRNIVGLRLGEGFDTDLAWFDLSGSGSVISFGGTIISANISTEPNGWFRISANGAGSANLRMDLRMAPSAGTNTYVGNTSLGVYAWGVMLESSATLSTYTPTSGSGINSMMINKPGSATVTLSGSIGTLNLNNSLSLNSGLFDIGSKAIAIRGNLNNNTEIIATSSGRVRLTGVNTQNISGNGNGILPYLVLSNTGGVNGDTRYTSTAAFRVLNALEMTTNKIFDIGNKRITFASAANLISTSGSFSSTRFIRTGGFLSDAGIAKEFSTSSPSFVFAFGTGSNYTPASITFTSNPTTYGALNVRPVAVKHLYVTDPNALEYYWKVNQTGFAGIGANSVQLTFNYGNLPDNTAYVPGYYNYQDIAYTTINNVNEVNETNNTIQFIPFSKIDGDFTAGVPAAFGAVIPYYSRTDGPWSTPSTWSNTGHGGLGAAGVPGANNPVYIGDGIGFNHSVSVISNNTFAGSLIIDNGSTLTIGTTTGHNFGALPYSTAGGAGTIRISSNTPVAEFPGGDFGLFFTNEGGTAEYYASSVSFTLPLSTALPNSLNINGYKNLRLAASGSNIIYLPDLDLTILEDLTINGTTSSKSTMSNVQSRNLQINRNLNITQGIFELPDAFEQNITLNGNLVIGNNGSFQGASSGSAEHQLNILGSIVNNGVIQFNTSSPVTLQMTGNTSASIGGTYALAQLNLGPLQINKGSDQTLNVNINSLGSISAPTSNWLSLINGSLLISRAGNLTLSDQPDEDFSIPASAALVLNNSALTINASVAASNTSDLLLAGKLEIQGGTMNIGNEANNNHNDIEYAAAGTPTLIISGNGTLNVNGQIRRSINVLLGSLNYYQSGNSLVFVRGRMPELSSFNLNRAKFEVLNDGSVFQMSDNSLLLIDRNGPASNIFGDIYLSPASAAIIGGEIMVGTSNTASNSLFEINSHVPLWNLAVDGTTTTKTLRLLGTPIQIQNNLRILGNSSFNANSLNVGIGGNLLVENSSAATGLNVGGFQVISTSQVTTLNSTANSQTITGLGANLINFANLVVNNTFPSGLATLASGTNIRINGNLNLTSGNFNSGTNLVTVLGNVTNNVIHTSAVGGYIEMSGSINQTISGNGSGQFGNLRINNTAGVEILNATRINGDLNLQNGLFYINNYLLTLGTSAGVSSPSLSENRMIRLNGVSSDAGVRKMFSAGAGNFTFPIGVSLKYSPATISVASNTLPGDITVRPVNTKHPGTTDAGNTELTYYWVTSGNGFSGGATYTHIYNYLQTDATNGNENLYVTGRYFSNQWVPQNGIPATVNAASNTITLSGVNYINGEFTAGEPQEFGAIQVYYSITSGDYTDPNSWSVDPILKHTGAPAFVAPTFNPIVIASGHTITGNSNSLNAPTAEINGVLNLNNTISHNFGIVTGTGKIQMTPTVANQFIFPGGTYSAFVASGGGTIEYIGAVTASLPSRTTYNNLLFSGVGNKTLFNSDIQVNGNFEISQGTVTNTYNKQISVKGDFKNSAGFTAFNGGIGVVNMTGMNQQFDGSSQFSNLTISGGGLKTLNASIEITNLLQLTNGLLVTGGNLVIIPLGGNVSGASATSYVNGRIQKFINNVTASKSFEIGDASQYTPVQLNFTGTISGSGSLTMNTSNGDHPSIASSGLNPSRSVNRYWSIVNSGLTISSYNATFNFVAGDIDGGSNTNTFNVARKTGASWFIGTTGIRTAFNTQAIGLNAFGDFQVGEQLGSGYTWTGSISRDWNDPNNWLPIGVPGVNDDVSIPNKINDPDFPTLVNGLCKNVEFLAGAEINLPSGVTLTVGGNWIGTNTQVKGSGTLRFTSPAANLSGVTTVNGIVAVSTGANLITNNGLVIANNASLMHGVGTPGGGGSVSGNVIIRRNGFSSLTQYNYWSSPINNAALGVLGSNRYVYNPVAATASSGQGLLAGWQNAGGAMSVAKGYIATGSGGVSFNGTVNNGNLNTGSTSIGAYTSSNLIGNPYPSAISAAAFVAANPNIQGGAVYVWDDDNSGGSDYAFNDYITWNGIGIVSPNSLQTFNGNIALGQGFFVNVANTNPIQFSNNMRTALASTFFEAEPIQRFWLNVTADGNKYNETLIGFKSDATPEEDMAYDARKITGNENLAFYSCIANKGYSIQAIPFLTDHTTIQLGLDASSDGTQTIRLGQVDEMDETAMIILEDKKLGVFHNLRVHPEYTFEYNHTTDKRRFKLHLYAGMEFATVSESCQLNDGSLSLKNPPSLPWDVSIQNAEGIQLKSVEAFTGNLEINNLPAGNYLAILKNSFGSTVYKNLTIEAGTPVKINAAVNGTSFDTHNPVEFTALISGPYQLLTWDLGDGTILTGTSAFTHQYLLPGVYTVRISAVNAKCSEEQLIVIRVEETLAGFSNMDDSSLSIYPNPVVNSQLNIRMNGPVKGEHLEICLFDLSGKLLYKDVAAPSHSGTVHTISMIGLAPGVYQVTLKSANQIYNGRVVKSN